jgi:hypothetical protein
VLAAFSHYKASPMNTRIRLPNRRPCENFDFEFYGMRYNVTAGRLPNGSLIEVFVSNHKSGNASDVAARDAGILLSLLLQHGYQIETISHAVSRNTDGSASGVIGAVLDRIMG